DHRLFTSGFQPLVKRFVPVHSHTSPASSHDYHIPQPLSTPGAGATTAHGTTALHVAPTRDRRDRQSKSTGAPAPRRAPPGTSSAPAGRHVSPTALPARPAQLLVLDTRRLVRPWTEGGGVWKCAAARANRLSTDILSPRPCCLRSRP